MQHTRGRHIGLPLRRGNPLWLPGFTSWPGSFKGRHRGLPLQDDAMTRYDPDKHHRRSIRLRGYDYAQTGAYFVTICTQDRQCLFGEIRDGQMIMNRAISQMRGKMET